LVDSVESMMMHGLANPKITNLTIFYNGYKYIAFKVEKYLTQLLVKFLLSC